MKKIIAIILAAVIAVSMTACADTKGSDTETTTTVADVEIANPKTFEKSGIKITVSENFTEAEMEGYAIVLESKEDEIVLFGLKEPSENFAGFDEFTLEEYSDLVYNANAAKSPKEFEKNDDLLCMEYDYHNADENEDYSYLAAVFKGPDSFCTLQFACKKDNYEKLKPYFVKYLKSVEISE